MIINFSILKYPIYIKKIIYVKIFFPVSVVGFVIKN